MRDTATALAMMGLAHELLIVVVTGLGEFVGLSPADEMGPARDVARELMAKARARGAVAVLVCGDDATTPLLLVPPAAGCA